MNLTIRLKSAPTLRMRYLPGLKGDTGEAGTIALGPTITGAPGTSASVANSGTPTAAVFQFTVPRGDVGADGERGWLPAFAAVMDGARSVLRLVDWVGGEGVKPATGSYVGAAGLVADIADAVDLRGPAGSGVPAGSITTAELANRAATFARIQAIASGRLLGRKTALSGDIEELTAAEARALLALALGDLANVDLATTPPAHGDGFVWDQSAGKWKPGSAGGGMFRGDNGTVGSRKGDIFRIAEQQLDSDVTIAADENAYAPGPLAIATGKTLTISAGGNLVVL